MTQRPTAAAPVLVVMSQDHDSDALTQRAVSLAQAHSAPIHGTYLVNTARKEHLGDCLQNRGFVGTAAVRSVTSLADETARQEGERVLNDLLLAAREKGLECDTEIVAGHLTETVLELAARTEAVRVLIARPRMGVFGRLFGERDLRQLRQKLAGSLVIVESEHS